MIGVLIAYFVVLLIIGLITLFNWSATNSAAKKQPDRFAPLGSEYIASEMWWSAVYLAGFMLAGATICAMFVLLDKQLSYTWHLVLEGRIRADSWLHVYGPSYTGPDEAMGAGAIWALGIFVILYFGHLANDGYWPHHDVGRRRED